MVQNYSVKFVCLLTALLLTAALFAGNAAGQQAPSPIRVQGKVSDASGNPLSGVAIVAVGLNTGATSGNAGEYSIACPSDAVLEFSYLGYKKEIVPVSGRTLINVSLEEERLQIDEVIVVGYGTTTRRRATGAVDQIKADAIMDRSTANLTQALQGTSPSLTIQQRSFNPNDQQLNINIRGIGTMNDNSPLIVIDGLVSDGASLNKLNPADIESISVLKDAGTAAIYGSRSANGVLLVTTKKGKRNQAPVVQLNAMIGMQTPKMPYTPVRGYQNATLNNLAKIGAGQQPGFTAEQIRDLQANGDSEFFMNTILRDALQQSYNASISGGGEKSTYMISAGYNDQESNYVGQDWGVKRYNFRTNVTTEYKNVTVTGLLSYTRNDNTKVASANINNNASRIPVYYYYKMKDPATGHYLVNDILTDHSPLGLLEKGGKEQSNNDYINANLQLDYKIAKGLKLRGVLGADIFADHRFIRRESVDFYSYLDPSKYVSTANVDGDAEDYNRQAWLINSQVMLDYDRTFCQKHHVSALVGASNESFTSTDNQIRLKSTDPTLGIKGDGTIADISGSWNTPQSTTKRSITSVFGRVGYDYDAKYFLDATFRYDGSSKFDKDYRWGFFPSVSAGWNITGEKWMQGVSNTLSNLKLRASWGTLGNQSVGDYQYFTTFDVYADTYGFNNVSVGGAGFQIGTHNLRWEVSKTWNVGVDAALFRNSLNFHFDYFRKNTTDILVKPQTPLTFGTELQNYNAGEMLTQGWELAVSYNLRHGDFSHMFNLSFGDSWNEVTHYEGFEDIVKIEQYWRIMREGLPFNSYYGYKTAGIFQSYDQIASAALPTNMTVQPGDLQFVDRNGDGTIDENDRFYLGNAFPRYTVGFTYDFRWKNLDFSLFLQGVLKRDMMLRGELVEPFHSSYGYTMYEHQLDYWTPTNPGARYPRLALSGKSQENNWGMGSDVYLYDASYLRVKNISIGYTLPQKWTSKIGMKKLRAYVNAQNLFTFSKLSFIDPESSEYGNNMNSGGANSGRVYPSLRYYGMGFDITF